MTIPGAHAVRSARGLLLFPCNGNAVEALDCIGPGHRVLGFVDDTPEKQGTRRHGHPVLGRAALREHPDAEVLAVPGGPGSFRGRRAVIEGLGVATDRYARVIHPHARVSPLAQIGRNVLLMAGVVVTSNAVIGDHVCVLPNSVIHHDAVVGAFTLVGSNVTLAGGTVVGENCYVASGTSVMHGLEIGAGALIGLGSTVIRNVPAGATVAGTPARALPHREA